MGRAEQGRCAARGLVIAGGQDRLAGQILRVGHLGDVHTGRRRRGHRGHRASRSTSWVATSTSPARSRGAAAASIGERASAPGSRRLGGVRVLVAEPLSSEGLELLRDTSTKSTTGPT